MLPHKYNWEEHLFVHPRQKKNLGIIIFRTSKFCNMRLVVILFHCLIFFLFWSLVPFQVSLLSDPKIKSGLWSVFVTALLICGAYFVGSAVLAKDFTEVHIVASIPSSFLSLKKRFCHICDLTYVLLLHSLEDDFA